ncbi:hypothetical protein ACFSHQ_12325 [Gemmobacter lanyuensis]
MVGGAGDDVLHVADAADLVVEAADGDATAWSPVSATCWSMRLKT